MKIDKLFLGLCACAAMCACSNDESGIIQGDDRKVFTGDEAYISVRLSDAATLTRATSPENSFEYGVDEREVKNAYFYFYDADGLFVAQGNAWNGGDAEESKTDEPDGNIEFKSKTIVVLKGLNKKNYPKYMVTVLNKPANFMYGNTLEEMETALADNDAEGIYYTDSGTNYFAMSTTSFGDQKDAEGNSLKYFVTEVENKNFATEPIPTDLSEIPNPVTAYVERLAVKVSLKVSQDLQKDENGRYLVKATVAGEDNNSSPDGAYENLYVELLGWKLNATAKKSNIVKNIDETWTGKDLGFVWNKPGDYRSYWGKSFNYGKDGSYPSSAGDLYDDRNNLTPNEYLNYVNLKGATMSESAYCAENTNTSEIVSNNFPSAVTSILLKAKICDAEGNGLDLVRYKGMLFKQEQFLDYMLNNLQLQNKLNMWYQVSGENTYKQINREYVKLENMRNGEVKVVFTKDKHSDVTLYKKDGETYTAITDNDDVIATLNSNLAELSDGATAYTGGLMYYNIPIEHLNNADIQDDGTIPEAKYGVVRNHHYVVTINKLENIGKGIFDEEEVIVPQNDDDETYYVGANINILSWKIVEQSVDL